MRTRVRRYDEHNFTCEVEELIVSAIQGKKTGESRMEWKPKGFYTVTPGGLKLACHAALVEGMEGQDCKELRAELAAAVHALDGTLEALVRDVSARPLSVCPDDVKTPQRTTQPSKKGKREVK
jgi:hypothetical protein